MVRLSLASRRPSLRWLIGFLVCVAFLWTSAALFVNLAPTPLADGVLHGDPRPYHPPSVHPPSSPTSSRAERVRQAFVHAYWGYQQHALPNDELLPVSGGKVNKYIIISPSLDFFC